MSFNYQQRGKFSLKKGMLGLLVSLSFSGYAAADYTSGGTLQIQNADETVFNGNVWGIDLTPSNQLTILAQTGGGFPHTHLLGHDVKITSSVDLGENSRVEGKKKILALDDERIVVVGEGDGVNPAEDPKVAILHEGKFGVEDAHPHSLKDGADDPIPSNKVLDITFGDGNLYTFLPVGNPENTGTLFRWAPEDLDVGAPDEGTLGELSELLFEPDDVEPLYTATGPIAANKAGDAHVYLATNGGRSLIALEGGVDGDDEPIAKLVDNNSTFDLADHGITGTIQDIQVSGEKLYLLMEDAGARKIVAMDKIGGAVAPEAPETIVEGLAADATVSIANGLGTIYTVNGGDLSVHFDPSKLAEEGQVNLGEYTLRENLTLGADQILNVQRDLTIEGNKGALDGDGNPTPTIIALDGGELKARQITLSGEGDVQINATADSSITSPISGTGGIKKQGAGRLTLGADGSEEDQNTYEEDTVIEEGEMVLQDRGASANSLFVLSNGTTLEVAKNSTIKGLSGNGGTVDIADNKTLTLQGANGPLTYSGTIARGQNLVIAGGTQRFTGPVTATTTIDAGATMELGAIHTGPINVSGKFVGSSVVARVTNNITIHANGHLQTWDGTGDRGRLVVDEDVILDSNTIVKLVTNDAMRAAGEFSLTARDLVGLGGNMDNLRATRFKLFSPTDEIFPIEDGNGDLFQYPLVYLTGDNPLAEADPEVLATKFVGQRIMDMQGNNLAQQIKELIVLPGPGGVGLRLFATLKEAAAIAAGNATGEAATYVAALGRLANSGNADAQRLVQILEGKTAAQEEEIVEQLLPRDTAQVSDVSSQASAATKQSIRTHLRNQSQQMTTTRQMNAVSTQVMTNQEKDHFIHLVQQASAAPALGIQKLARVSASHKGHAVDSLEPRTGRLPDELNVGSDRVNIWLQQAIARGDFGKRRQAKAMKSDTYTTTIGMDYRVTDRALLGVFFGYGKSDFDFAKSQGKGKVKTFSGGLYGSWNPYQTLDIDFSAMISKHDYRKKRPTALGEIRSSHDGIEYGLSARASYGFAFWDTGEIRPYVETGFDQLREERYHEKGLLANTIGKRNSKFWNAGAGVEISKTYVHKSYTLRPSASVGYIHRNASGDAGRVQYNLGGTAGTYRIKGDSSDRNRFLVGASVATLFKNNVYVTAGYNGELSSKDKIHEALLRVGVTF